MVLRRGRLQLDCSTTRVVGPASLAARALRRVTAAVRGGWAGPSKGPYGFAPLVCFEATGHEAMRVFR
jgi:hypothetical protein